MEIKTFGKSEKYVSTSPKYPKELTVWKPVRLELMCMLCFVWSDINSYTSWSLMPTAEE